MSNAMTVDTGTAHSSDVAIGTGIAHSSCHVHRFEDDIVIDVECRLEQEGEVVSGFLHCDKDATFIVEVTLDGRLADHLCGYLCAAAHIECFGPADPEPLETKTKEFDCNIIKHPIQFEFEIPADHIPCGGGGADRECGQVCCFAASITSFTKCWDPGHLGCMCRGPCVMVHREPAHDEEEEG